MLPNTKKLSSVVLFAVLAGFLFSCKAPSKEKEGAAMLPNTKKLSSAERSGYHLFYLHGKIVEDLGERPKSETHGYYEYREIVSTLEKQGFIVHSEVRPKNTDIREYAENTAEQIRILIKEGVPKSHISVVGASKGGSIALHISNLLKDKELHFVFLAGLFHPMLQDPSLKLYGNVLSIHDASDEFPIDPEGFFQRSAGLGKHRSIVTQMGIGHGLIYRPYDEWLTPLVQWVR